METPQENEPEYDNYQDQEDAVEIYSRAAIFGFSIFFSTLFGGVLLVINLFKAGLRSAALQVLLFSIVFTFIPLTIIKSLAALGNLILIMPIIFNVIGGFILTNYFFPKYFPDDDYYPRSIWGALMVSIIICLAYLLVAGQFIDPAAKPIK